MESWTIDPVALLEKLVAEAPELAELWADHRRENFDAPLPHLFMSEVAEWFASSDMSESRRRLCGVLEKALVEGSSDVREVIQVSFVENLPPQPPKWIGTCFGPALAADLKRHLG